jgi:drug/metabolite transporter (DMT)-like permease
VALAPGVDFPKRADCDRTLDLRHRNCGIWNASASSLIGDVIAMIMTLSFAISIVLAKAHPRLPLLEVTLLSTLLTFVIFLPFASSGTID